MKVVVDTNCLIASIPKNNPEHWLYIAFRQERFVWCLSNEILMEYEEVIARFYSMTTANLVLSILLTADNVLLTEPFYRYGLIPQDPEDNKFADLAISANVDYLLSNDRHFQALKKIEFPKVHVVTLEEFENIMRLV
ncbi:MAG: putative toxin-antitoxin system toxin component, PIN family [Saprospiraceae bacterium]|nr:putative toxin-antitoxin system toxin component, PIN family [Saprospiraceae bacterium]